jgi:hypothetical protein
MSKAAAQVVLLVNGVMILTHCGLLLVWNL